MGLAVFFLWAVEVGGAAVILRKFSQNIFKPGDLYSPEMNPTLKCSQIDPEMIPIFLHVDPEMNPINSWNGMVFRRGIITSLLQRLRSWNALNISIQFTWF